MAILAFQHLIEVSSTESIPPRDMERDGLLKIKNFGKKSLVEIEKFLATQELDFDMDLTPYRLDND